MRDMISGGVAMGYLVAGLFFLRFWKRTRDTLFFCFAVSFWILATTRIGLVLTFERYEGTVFYVFRFIAFTLIIWAIWNKNTTSKNNQSGH
jgi:hypothetical protein